MKNNSKILCLILSVILSVTFAACSPVDSEFGDNTDKKEDGANTEIITDFGKEIMSSDRVMSQYFDISLFDEENYSDIYLGKKFKIDATFLSNKIPVPTKISNLKKLGWVLSEGNTYDLNSLVFAYETIDLIFINNEGALINAQAYNSSRSSVKLSECYIVKYKIDNNFYQNPQSYNPFNINGITNSMAITDIINTLGTPSHFYKVSDQSYYLDYFITKKDRRNGITIYINPTDDSITAIEFSYYK